MITREFAISKIVFRCGDREMQFSKLFIEVDAKSTEIPFSVLMPPLASRANNKHFHDRRENSKMRIKNLKAKF